MIALWMLYSMVTGALLAGASRLLERPVRSLGGSTRFVPTVAVVACIVATVAGALAVDRQAPLEPRDTAPVTSSPDQGATRSLAAARIPGRREPIPAELPTRDVARAEPAAPARAALMSKFSSSVAHAMPRTAAGLRRWDGLLAAVWAGLSALLVLRLFRDALALRRALAAAERREVDGAHILLTDELGPAAVSAQRPVIVLPRWALTLDPSLRTLVLRHEQEHLEARDQRLVRFAAAVVILLPWNLALWWLLRRVRLAVEIDCDARVLRQYPNVRRYAELLLLVAQRATGYSGRGGLSPLTALPLGPSAPSLNQRIEAMTRPRTMKWTTRTAMLAVAVTFTVGATALPRPVRPAAVVAQPPLSAIESRPSAEHGAGQIVAAASVTAPTPTSRREDAAQVFRKPVSDVVVVSGETDLATPVAAAPLAWTDSLILFSGRDGRRFVDVVVPRSTVTGGLLQFDTPSAAWRGDTIRVPVGTVVRFADMPLRFDLSSPAGDYPLVFESLRQIFDGREQTWFRCTTAGARITVKRAAPSAKLGASGSTAACAKTRPDTPAGAEWSDSLLMRSVRRGAEWVDLILPRDAEDRGLVRFEGAPVDRRADTVRVSVGTVLRFAKEAATVTLTSHPNDPEIEFMVRGRRNLNVEVHGRPDVYREQFRCTWTGRKITLARPAAAAPFKIAFEGPGRNECWAGL